MLKIIQTHEYNPHRCDIYSKLLGLDSIVKRIQLEKKLKVHTGCVNSIVWNHTGEYILSGSDDLKLVITNPFNGRVAAKIPSGHRRNIFQARFMPESGNGRIVSCAAGGTLVYTRITRPVEQWHQLFNCHKSTAYQVRVTPGDPHTFLSCSEDGTLRSFDLREQESCMQDDCRKNILLDFGTGVSAMDIDPIRPYLLATATRKDSIVRIFDRRMISDNVHSLDQYTVRRYVIPAESDKVQTQTTCLQYDKLGEKLLVNTTPKHIIELDCWSDDVTPLEMPANVPSVSADTEGEAQQTSPPTTARENMIVRLTGDWSDTGPSSLLHTEPNVGGNLSHTDRMFRQMSAALTSVLRVRNEAVSRAGDISEESEDEEESSSAAQQNSPAATDANVKSAEQHPSHHQAEHTIGSMCNINMFSGHRNKRTAIKQCSYWGDDLIVGGSDCGHIFIWRKSSGQLLNVIAADKRVVNCVQPHPEHPVLATSGIDYDIKLWTPKHADEGYFEENAEYITQVLKKNEEFLRDQADVVTVPTRFIAPLLALLARSAATDEQEEG